ncbi:NADH dehydrogenase subunit 6 (mitochondrion) [Hyalella azteca]|uniref:NADH dehydrogenase subunit 6 n=1 Tax=Hyalella azteca TaxID=294128 RepID=A0A385UKV2_HYAAZ|nr:NADH dehydrogenase subunit 6 [Hyalella azteca]AYB71625.1 NADH dehydrogenase subunit 6 [Hyalella azteca]
MLALWMSLCMGLVFLFLQLTAPLSLGAVVVLFSFLASLSIYLICPTAWFSLLLVLLFLSGMMVIFVYVASLAHNELYAYPFNYGLFVLILMSAASIFNDKVEWVFLNELSPTDLSPHFIVYKAYSFGVYLFTSLLIVYLFISLVVVVKLATSSELPLRAKK